MADCQRCGSALHPQTTATVCPPCRVAMQATAQQKTDEAWPVETRRFLTHTALQRLLVDHGGWPGVAQWLYAGKLRPDGTRLPYTFSHDFIAPIIEGDAAAWAESRRKA